MGRRMQGVKQKSRFWAYIWLHCVLWTVPAASAIHLAPTDHGEFITLVAGERPSLLMAENNDEVYDKKPRTSFSSELLTRGCTTLMNWNIVSCLFGMTLTRPSLTMPLTSGVGVFAHVCRQKADTSRLFEQLLWQYSAIWQETFQFLSNVTRFLDNFFL